MSPRQELICRYPLPLPEDKFQGEGQVVHFGSNLHGKLKWYGAVSLF